MALSSFSPNFDINRLTLSFTTSTNLTASSLEFFVLQNSSSSPSVIIPLTGSTIVTAQPSLTTVITLSDSAVQRIKSQTTAFINGATTYLSTTFPTTVTVPSTSYVSDTTAPTPQQFTSYRGSVIEFAWSKPIISADVTKFTLYSAASGGTGVTLTDSTVITNGARFYIQLSNSDTQSLNAAGIGISVNNTFIQLGAGAVVDWKSNSSAASATRYQALLVGNQVGYTLPSSLSLTETDIALAVPDSTGLGTQGTPNMLTLTEGGYFTIYPSLSTLPQSGSWTSVAWGNGIYVTAADNTNVAASSTNGITWTQRTMPANAFWTSTAWGNNTFVSIAYDSNIAATSTDGVTWTQQTLSSDRQWRNVAYGNGAFVAVAQNNSNVATVSTNNGVNWTDYSIGTSANWSSLAWGNGRFVAVSSGNRSATSTDGQTWTVGTMPDNATWASVTWGNSGFIAVAYDSDLAAVSSDGISWTLQTLSSNTLWTDITYGNGVYVAVSASDAVAVSLQGNTWNQSSLGSGGWESVTYGNNEFVAVASGSNAVVRFTTFASDLTLVDNTLRVTGVSDLGSVSNVKISGGNVGQFLQTDGAGNLTWANGGGGGGSGDSISNGNSNVTVAANSNVTVSVGGVANILTVSNNSVQVSVGGVANILTVNSNGVQISGGNLVTTGTGVSNITSGSDINLTTGNGVGSVNILGNAAITNRLQLSNVNLITTTSNANVTNKLAIDIGGTTYYILLSTSPS